MTHGWRRSAQTFMVASLAITATALASERGGEYLFTIIALLLWAAALPYLAGMSAIKRLPHRWALASGVATSLFGGVDIVVRVRAFFFPTGSIDGGMAVWLPIYAVIAIPVLSVLVHTVLVAFSARPSSSGTST